MGPDKSPSKSPDKSPSKSRSAEEELSGEVQRLLHAMTGEMAGRDIQERFGLKHREHFRKVDLVPALAAGLIERTAPDKPTSRLQRYRLTETGTSPASPPAPGPAGRRRSQSVSW